MSTGSNRSPLGLLPFTIDWRRPEPGPGRAVPAYFESTYPRRGTLLSRLAFRHGEASRLRHVRQYLPAVGGRSLLDAGCGDGEFLARLLAQGATMRPRVIRLEDLVAANVRVATARIAGYADRIEAGVEDACRSHCGRIHDVVLAIGVLDYWTDWPQRLSHLVSRSRRVTIVTLPVPDGLHYHVRNVWLARHQITVPRIREDELQAVLRAIGGRYHVQRTRFEWVVRIDSADRGTTNALVRA